MTADDNNNDVYDAANNNNTFNNNNNNTISNNTVLVNIEPPIYYSVLSLFGLLLVPILIMFNVIPKMDNADDYAIFTAWIITFTILTIHSFTYQIRVIRSVNVVSSSSSSLCHSPIYNSKIIDTNNDDSNNNKHDNYNEGIIYYIEYSNFGLKTKRVNMNDIVAIYIHHDYRNELMHHVTILMLSYDGTTLLEISHRFDFLQPLIVFLREQQYIQLEEEKQQRLLSFNTKDVNNNNNNYSLLRNTTTTICNLNTPKFILQEGSTAIEFSYSKCYKLRKRRKESIQYQIYKLHRTAFILGIWQIIVCIITITGSIIILWYPYIIINNILFFNNDNNNNNNDDDDDEITNEVLVLFTLMITISIFAIRLVIYNCRQLFVRRHTPFPTSNQDHYIDIERINSNTSPISTSPTANNSGTGNTANNIVDNVRVPIPTAVLYSLSIIALSIVICIWTEKRSLFSCWNNNNNNNVNNWDIRHAHDWTLCQRMLVVVILFLCFTIIHSILYIFILFRIKRDSASFILSDNLYSCSTTGIEVVRMVKRRRQKLLQRQV